MPIKRSHIMWTALFIGAFVLCVLFFATHPRALGGRGGTRVTTDLDISQGWVTDDGAVVSLSELGALEGVSDHFVSIHRRLPGSIESGIELNFLSRNIAFHLLYGGKEVYGYDLNEGAEGRAYAPHFNFAPLSPEDAGKEVTIQIRQIYADSAALIQDMRLSGTTAYIQRYVILHGFAFALAMVIAFIGLAVIVLAMLSRNVPQEFEFMSLGGISVLLGIWSGAETLVPQLVTGQEILIRAAEYTALSLCPYLLVRFMGSLVRPRSQELCNRVALSATLVGVLTTVALILAFDYDMHQLLYVSQALLVVCCGLALLEALQVIRDDQERRSFSERDKRLLAAFLCVVVCAVLDMAKYFLTARATDDSAFFMRIGLLVFSATLAIEAFRVSADYVQRANRTAVAEAMAYEDALTGIANRTAWQVARDKLDEAYASGEIDDVLVCQFDLNYLKKINDSKGHGVGDDFLKHAAEFLEESFGAEGTCYRTGGDEFTVLVVGDSLSERFAQCSKRLTDLTHEWGGQVADDTPFSLAAGHALVSETPEKTLEAARLLADARMYEDKRAHKTLREE